jgi:hypothetical protein
VGHLASLADQVAEIQYAAPGDATWPLIFRTPQNLHAGPEIGLMLDTGNLGHGAMLRVLDVKLGLEAFPVAPAARGEMILDIDDPVVPANTRAWRVTAREGRMKVRPDRVRAGVRPVLPRLRVPADMLGPLIAGTIPASSAAEVGLIGASDGAGELADHWFRTRPAYVYRFNGF